MTPALFTRIQPGFVGQPRRECAHRPKTRQVQLLEAHARPWEEPANALHRRSTLLLTPRREDDLAAGPGELQGRVPPDAAVCARDQGHPSSCEGMSAVLQFVMCLPPDPMFIGMAQV